MFADRFKEYGAYQIRSQFSKNQSLATLIALSVTTLFAAMPIIVEHFFPKEKENNTQLKVTNIDDVKAPEEEKEELEAALSELKKDFEEMMKEQQNGKSS